VEKNWRQHRVPALRLRSGQALAKRKGLPPAAKRFLAETHYWLALLQRAKPFALTLQTIHQKSRHARISIMTATQSCVQLWFEISHVAGVHNAKGDNNVGLGR
jgi:hypothetical protein